MQGVRRRPLLLRAWTATRCPPIRTPPTRGVPISRQLRRAYLRETLRTGEALPVPFEPSDADAFSRWRRRAWRPIARGLFSETAKRLRIVLPEEYDTVKKRFPRLADRQNTGFSGGTGIWA